MYASAFSDAKGQPVEDAVDKYPSRILPQGEDPKPADQLERRSPRGQIKKKEKKQRQASPVFDVKGSIQKVRGQCVLHRRDNINY